MCMLMHKCVDVWSYLQPIWTYLFSYHFPSYLLQTTLIQLWLYFIHYVKNMAHGWLCFSVLYSKQLTSLLVICSHFLGSRFFRFRQAALSLMNTKQSLPQEDPDAVMVDQPKENEGSMALQSFPSPTKSICSPIETNDTHGLIGSSHHSSQASVGPEPIDHSSPILLWEKLYQTEPQQSSTTLSNTFPRGSFNSMRRASSVHEIEAYSSNSKSIFGDRTTSEGM